MARNRLDDEELTVLAAAVGVIRGEPLRRQVATKIKSAIEPHEPYRMWNGEVYIPFDWTQWFVLCRIKSLN